MAFPVAGGGASPDVVEGWIREMQQNQHMTQKMNAINNLPCERGSSDADFRRERVRGADAAPAKYP